MARPIKKIDLHQLEMCAEKHWSITEIAAHFRVSTRTITRRYVKVIEEARQRGKTKLRDLQWKRAIEGSDTMIKHMSEHYLDQHQKNKVETTGKDGGPIQTNEIKVLVTIPDNGRDK